MSAIYRGTVEELAHKRKQRVHEMKYEATEGEIVEALKRTSTKDLLRYLDLYRKHGRIIMSMSNIIFDHDMPGTRFDIKLLRDELNTREHIPTSPQDKKRARQEKARMGREKGRRDR